MKLMVKYGKSNRYPPIHPTLRIMRDSGYCRNQWTEQHFRPGCFPGAECVRDTTVEQAVARYFADLRRMNYTEVSE